MNKYIEQAEDYARDYDRESTEQGYYAPDIMFGLMFEYLSQDDHFLDIAIGTGLDAALFKKAGARVFGIDGAEEMLKICAEKKISDELKRTDLLEDPIPYPDGYFGLALANSLFHMIENPYPVFHETSRVLKNSGIFGFTVDEIIPGKTPVYKTQKEGVHRIKNSDSGLYIYRHSDEFIRKLCVQTGFTIVKKLEFLSYRGKDGAPDHYYTAYIARKK